MFSRTSAEPSSFDKHVSAERGEHEHSILSLGYTLLHLNHSMLAVIACKDCAIAFLQ